MLLGTEHGFVMAMTPDGQVAVHRTSLGDARALALVQRVRAAMDVTAAGPKPFDMRAAAEIYAELLKPLEATLEGAQTLVVVPDGPLLGIPFALLLTAPGDAAAMGAAPWLVRRHAIVHVPSPQTLVTQRAAAAGAARLTPMPASAISRRRPPRSSPPASRSIAAPPMRGSRPD